MTQADLIAALPPGRLPADLLTFGPADLLALFGLGLLLAALAVAAAGPLFRRRPSVHGRIRATRGLPTAERALAIARILGHPPESLRDAAYRGAEMSDNDFERLAIRGRRRR